MDKRVDEEEFTEAITSRTAHVVHLTHNDLDAVGADAIHRMKLGDVFTVFTSVGKFPFYLDRIAGTKGYGDLLSITDFGYHRSAEKNIRIAKANGWRVEWRDHHRWREEETVEIRRVADVLNVDVSTCGCGICARDFLPQDHRASEVARVVCDYDLWKNDDPKSAVLGLVLQKKENREYVRDRLVEGIFSDERIESEYREVKSEMDRMIAKSIRNATMEGKKYRIAFSPLYGYPSETAAEMRKALSTEIEVLVSKSGRFSIRSVPPISHLLAREFQGGGHPHAAGGMFSFTFADRIAFLLFKRSRHFRSLADLAETM
jgi:oligoribonuclease NrnB/cAMP/cGMP phosphodiesterase (DHH superfamily)